MTAGQREVIAISPLICLKSVGIKNFSETMRPTTQVTGIGSFSLLFDLAIGFCLTFGFQSISFVRMHRFHSRVNHNVKYRSSSNLEIIDTILSELWPITDFRFAKQHI